MPIYRYRCECGTELESIRSVARIRAPLKCPNCGSVEEREPIIQPCHFQFEPGIRTGTLGLPSFEEQNRAADMDDDEDWETVE